MSTRSQIGFYENKNDKIEDFQALIYRHSDGYMGTVNGKKYGVLCEIVPFLKWFNKTRGYDFEYCSARLLQYLCNLHDNMSKDFKYNGISDKFTGILGYGICNQFHFDIEFFYKVYPYGLDVFSGYGNPKNFKFIKTIKT
jgi:hypothetical protein